ncbi:hypothetical protein IWW45_006343 [Coemansia sp. RSA 485]|nr:hypothetical protein IWW45_006343 [Coemansia sp. RSA 485]KAJ2602308.1 hypothetical protein GGF39_000798 [Coemansia sp. RSA 1721]
MCQSSCNNSNSKSLKSKAGLQICMGRTRLGSRQDSIVCPWCKDTLIGMETLETHECLIFPIEM